MSNYDCSETIMNVRVLYFSLRLFLRVEVFVFVVRLLFVIRHTRFYRAKVISKSGINHVRLENIDTNGDWRSPRLFLPGLAVVIIGIESDLDRNRQTLHDRSMAIISGDIRIRSYRQWRSQGGWMLNPPIDFFITNIPKGTLKQLDIR